jgi:hypothetical protein
VLGGLGYSSLVKAGVLIVLALVLAGTADAGRRPAVVRVAALRPVVVQGARFHARERVTVSYVGSVRRTRKVIASSTGSFTTTFQAVIEDRCNGFSVSAVGASGDRAVAKHLPLPACAPA